ncbi:hypothetical protein CHL76_12030 [Marinococcus halophilus]|uniref:Uncharacterized protein n=1 Tax=Marinococcus halophilus TaxID=1371 RepID=A0A510Y7S5_MARHA|nr:hypothetical protein [Marinococcus halophilus]OZT79634.1 hypothetical protein CHL76_12030 [Marinococcus halophilus]GEK59426.1 hypothetical protein MHA01_23310 [Marinococcus halophilus]
MDTIKTFKYFSIVLLFLLLLFNGFFFFSNQTNAPTEAEANELESQVSQLQEENDALEQQVEYQSKTEREARFDELESQTAAFMNTAFVHTTDNYAKQKDKAENIMSDQLMDRFFSAEMYGGGEVTTDIANDEYFIKNMEDSEQAQVIVRLDHQIHYTETGTDETSPVLMKVYFERQNGTWVAQRMEDISDTEGGFDAE